MQKRIRTNIYPSKPKNGVGKDCEGKGVFLLLNSCDESQIRISAVSKNKKGEPLIAVACAGCGRTQLLRPRRVVLCDEYTCGFGGHCAKNPRFVLPAVRTAAFATSFLMRRVLSVDTTLALQTQKK